MIIRIGLLLLSIGIVLISLSSVSIAHHYVQNVSFFKSYKVDVNPLMIDPELSLSYNGTAEVMVTHKGITANYTTPAIIPLREGCYQLSVLKESSFVKFVNSTLPPTKCDNSTTRLVPINVTGNVTAKLVFSGVKTTLYGEQWTLGGIVLIIVGIIIELFSVLKRVTKL